MNHDNRLRGRIALLAVGLLITFGGIAAAIPGGPAQAQLAPNAPSIYRAVPLDTPSPTPSSGEPEWAIMQYVVTTHPQWTCSAIGGAPGHRTLGCYSGVGHSGSGTVDNYGDPGSASATWQQRRTQAQTIYAIFQNTGWNNYPGYHGEGPRPPYDFFTQEDYYWADVRVLGGIRVDDTGYHYAPDIATAIMEAATALGYLPQPSPTPTAETPTATSTPSPSATPTGISTPAAEPELAILQYVRDHNFFWMCFPIGGTPGHRTLSCYSMAGHWADGTVDNYGAPEVAAANWQQRRSLARGYPHFTDISYNGYPGYDGYDEVYDPTAEWEDYYWADVRVLGAVRHDDTYYRYSPEMAMLIMQAAGILGYLPPPSPTPTAETPTATSTPSPSPTPTGTSTPSATTTGTPCSLQFTDVPAASPFYDYIRCLACRGIVGGYPCGGPGEPCPGAYFRPSANVTRGQVSKIVAEAAQWGDPVPSTQQTFEDVAPGSTFALWVERLSVRGIIGGYPCGGPFEPCVAPANRPYFRPGNNVTRGQLAKITGGAAGWTETPTAQTFEDVPPGSPFYLPIERLTARSIITGYPCGGAAEPCVAPANRPYFRPNNPATRGQLSKLAASAFFPACQTPNRR